MRHPIIFIHGSLIMLFTLLTPSVYSQDIQNSTINWTCSSTFNVESGTFDYQFTKVTSSPGQVVWYDSNNSPLYTLQVSEGIGSWTNVSADGSIIYKVTSGSSNGIVQFSRNGNDIRVRIHLSLENDEQIRELTVSNVNAQ